MSKLPDLFSLRDKKAIITGSSSGIGRRFASLLAAAGAHVILVARRGDLLKQVVEEIEENGGQAEYYAVDLSCRDSLDQLLTKLNGSHKYIDIIINNAGIGKQTPLDIAHKKRSRKFWDLTFDLNLKAYWEIISALTPSMIAHRIEASIINIASICGTDSVMSTLSAYSTSKAGVIQLTKSLAHELATHSIRVNAIAPGFIDTEMTVHLNKNHLSQKIPLGRVGEPEDLDGLLLYLASKASSYVTGSVFTVDGGLSVQDLSHA